MKGVPHDPQVADERRVQRVALLQSRVPGPLWFDDKWLVVQLVREGFWDVWVDSEPYQPIDGRIVEDVLDSRNLYFSDEQGAPLLYGIVQVKPKDAAWPEDVSLLQVGWEWKVDDFQLLDDPMEPEDALPKR